MLHEPEAPSGDGAPEIVLLSVSEIGSGALQAHLGELARRLSPVHRVSWGALVSPRLVVTRRGREELDAFRRATEADLSGRLCVVPYGPRFAGLGIAGALLGAALRAGGAGRGVILHARGYLATLAAIQARRALPGGRILHDVRGDRPAEVRLHGGEFAARRVGQLEAVACRAADAHLAVSAPLRDLLRERHGVEADVLPSAADTERFRPDPEGGLRVRAALGIGHDAFVLGFVGSAAPWQRPDAVAALFHELRRLRPGARLLVLSPDHATWSEELRRHGLECDVPGRAAAGAPVLVRRAPHAETPAWYSACDATALLRDDDDVNRVASPIKFGESLACGVPVLMTSRIGDASSLVRALGLGACFESPLLRAPGDAQRLADFLGRLAAGREALRAGCRAAAESRWSWAAQMPLRSQIYRRLAASHAGVACENPHAPAVRRAP